MIFSRNPPLVAQTEDTPPELSPIFTYLNIHTNKVYQEGYFLKLNDQDNRT
jgi:CCR4-NOT transcriptional complex subunit CAF120